MRFVYKQFAILGPESSRTAEASECAADQGKFWEYHDLVFENQATVRSSLNTDQLVTFATDINLDSDEFKKCLTGGNYSFQVAQETQMIGSLGIRGTPAFLVNGIFISGAQPFEVFEEIIEDQLALLKTDS